MFPSRICRSQVFLARYTGSSGDGGDEGAIPLKRVFIGFPYALDYVFIRWVRWPRKFIVDFMDIDRIYRFLRVEGRRRMIIRTRLFELRRWGGGGTLGFGRTVGADRWRRAWVSASTWGSSIVLSALRRIIWSTWGFYVGVVSVGRRAVLIHTATP